jgi:hypothetical protein
MLPREQDETLRRKQKKFEMQLFGSSRKEELMKELKTYHNEASTAQSEPSSKHNPNTAAQPGNNPKIKRAKKQKKQNQNNLLYDTIQSHPIIEVCICRYYASSTLYTVILQTQTHKSSS